MENKFPASIWLRPCHPCRDESDYYVCHPDHLNGSEAEYVRAAVADEALAALTEIADQRRTDELETEYDFECADFEGGYDQCINRARTVIAKLEGRS